MRALSSSLTFIFKVLFPSVWIVGLGAGTLLLWIVPADEPEESPVLIFTAGWIVGSALLLWMARALKEVWLEGEWLSVSSFRKRIAIPVRDIELVDEIRWVNIHPIRLYLARRSELGDRIVFMPRGPILPFVSHPLVEELTRLAEEARAGSAETPEDGDRRARQAPTEVPTRVPPA